MTPYRIESGQIAGAVVTFADVTRLKLAEIDSMAAQRYAEEAKADAELANQGKSRFLAAASHDLRQPLQTMELLHGVLERRVLDPESCTTLAQLGDAVAHMTDLLDSLLDINRLESGEIRPDVTDFSVAPVLARAYEELVPVAASKGVQLRAVRAPRSFAATAACSRVCSAICWRTRSNIPIAVKFSSDAGITATRCGSRCGTPASASPRTTSMPFSRNSIAWTGRTRDGPVWAWGCTSSGVSPSFLVTRWTCDRARQGNGVRPGGPAKRWRGGAGRSARPAADETSSPVILLVEDDPRQREAFRTLLELEGLRVMVAATGNEALGQLEEPSTLRPHVLVADYNSRVA